MASGRVAVVLELPDAVDQSLGCRWIKPLRLVHIHERSRAEEGADLQVDRVDTSRNRWRLRPPNHPQVSCAAQEGG